MKLIPRLVFVMFLVWACTSAHHSSVSVKADKADLRDSTEYDLLIIDPEFDLWYELHFSPALDKTNDTYQAYNSRAVSNWNYYFTTGRYSRIVESYIDYRTSVVYDLELNRRLYWYFKYVEDSFNLNLFK
jgi:hypothetical protein